MSTRPGRIRIRLIRVRIIRIRRRIVRIGRGVIIAGIRNYDINPTVIIGVGTRDRTCFRAGRKSQQEGGKND
jgi:hypothetical protein